MPADLNRYSEFTSELEELQKGLSSASYLRSIRAKVMDFLSRTDITRETSQDVRVMVRDLFDDFMTPWVNKFFDRYQDVLGAVNKHYADLGDDISRDFARIYATERAAAQQLGDYEDSVSRDMATAVRKAYEEKWSIEQLSQRIGALSEKAAFNADTIANTQLKYVSRVAKNEKAAIAEVFFFEYVGGVRGVTRAFCRVLHGTTHHLDTIVQLKNGNKEPVIDNCGGWNCIHDFEPDPFAEKADNDELVTITEGIRTIVIPGGSAAEEAYRKGKELSRRSASKNT